MPCPQSTVTRSPATLPQYLRRQCPLAHPDPANPLRSWQLRWPCSSSKNCRSNSTATIGGHPNGRSARCSFVSDLSSVKEKSTGEEPGAGGSEGQLLQRQNASLTKTHYVAYLTLTRERAAAGWRRCLR